MYTSTMRHFRNRSSVAKNPERNARSRDAVFREHKLMGCTCCRVFVVIRNGMKSVFMCECDL